jgi:isopentenyl diphosphate isomerase/L-lactate dehydrogenase-like FMN-dependent dehydrogenase
MGGLEGRWRHSLSRRSALRGVAAYLAGSPLLGSQLDPFRDHSRVPGLGELRTAFDFEPVAYAKLPRDIYDFMMGASDGEATSRRNRRAFDWVSLVPRGLADVSTVDCSSELLGHKLSYPILVAPTAGQGPLHPEGELAMHQGATAASNTLMIVSSGASFPIDRIAAAAKGPLWFQLYRMDTVEGTIERIERAQESGCTAIVWTVDGPVGPYRERVLHDRHLGGYGATDENNRQGDRARRSRRAPARLVYGLAAQVLDWRFLDTFRASIKTPLLIKGLTSAADARRCVENGIDGIIVSNHGARRVGQGCSTLEVLPEIADEVQGRIPILVDSGFRRGSDVLKALALGANAVCLGRVPRWGLAAYGPAGVQRILEILQAELVLAMANTGRPNLRSIDRTLVRTNFPPLAAAGEPVPQLLGEAPGRLTPRQEAVNTFEVEAMAQRSLPARLFSRIQGSDDRRGLDRIVFHPRVMVDITGLDLTLDLFGTKMYAPILVGPAARLQRFHPDGELGVVRGAGAAQSAVVVSGRASLPIEKLAAEAKSALWYQVYPERDMAPVLAGVERAVKAGCRAVCLTVGTPFQPAADGSPLKLSSVASPRTDWALVDQVRQAARVPVLLKGMLTPQEAQAAAARGVSGIIVSNQGGRYVPGLASSIEVLPDIVKAVDGKIPVLIDGGFRRGTDVIAALALGARAVLVVRPVLWGLAAYGAEGVQTVLEMLQTESARTMGLCGKPNLAALDRTLIRLDRR